MVNWQNYFDGIYVLNLPHRVDRKEFMQEQLNEYGIKADFFEATPSEKGYFGLLITMKSLFSECLDKKYNRVLVLEDDCQFVPAPEEFNATMDKCVNDLKSVDWDLFYLGLQHVKHFKRWETQNILPVDCGYSTHAVAYSAKAMEWIERKHIDEPIDNMLVREFQPYNTSFCAYPLLATQKEGYSDIENNSINWDMYISKTYEKHTRDILPIRNKAVIL